MKWDGLDNCLWSLMHISGMLYLNRMVGSIGTENGDAADVDHHLVLRDQHSVGGAVHHLQRGLRPRLPLPNVPRLRQPAGNEQLCAQLHHLLLLQQRVPQDAARGVSVLRPQTKAPQHIQLLQHAQHPRHLGRQRSQLRPYHQHIANQRANLQWTDRIPNTWPKTPENYYRNTSRSTFRVHFTDFYESSRGGGRGDSPNFSLLRSKWNGCSLQVRMCCLSELDRSNISRTNPLSWPNEDINCIIIISNFIFTFRNACEWESTNSALATKKEKWYSKRHRKIRQLFILKATGLWYRPSSPWMNWISSDTVLSIVVIEWRRRFHLTRTVLIPRLTEQLKIRFSLEPNKNESDENHLKNTLFWSFDFKRPSSPTRWRNMHS